MGLGFELSSSEDGIMTLVFTMPVDNDMFKNILEHVPPLLPVSGGKLLIDRRGQEIRSSLSQSIDFGMSFGHALMARGTKVALLREGTQVEEDIIAVQVYNSGVSLAQFDRKSEARAWLVGTLL